jgi:hypothetical protein
MTLVSDGIYTGPTEGLEKLLMRGREGDELQWAMDELPHAEMPEVTPMQFHAAVKKRKRGSAQAADGWRADHILDINKAPGTEGEHDPLGPLRIFSLNYAGGQLPVTREVYGHMAGGKVAALAKPGSTAPRPAVVVDLFRRVGMAAMLRENREELADEFGAKNEFGVGIPAPAQTIAWSMELAKEADPTVVQFWADMKNGYSEVYNSAVEKGLQKFPPKLQWMRRAFAAFYGKENTLHYKTRGGGAQRRRRRHGRTCDEDHDRWGRAAGRRTIGSVFQRRGAGHV